MQELDAGKLSVRQKLGMCMIGHIRYWEGMDFTEDNEYALNLIREHALGAVWVDRYHKDLAGVMKKIREIADYPILIMTDAENGIGDYLIGMHNAIGCTDNEDLARAFGRVTAISARKMGYNTVCNPVLDMTTFNAACGITMRSLGGDKYRVSRLAVAEARGMHEGGVLSVAKHFPGILGDGSIDSHMAEVEALESREELLDYHLYPYLQLMKENLLDGIMTMHSRVPKVDPDYPASLSKKVIGLIREQGFEGVALTDALVMMGVAAKFGAQACKPLAIANGNDLALMWGENKESYEALLDGWEKGVIPEERLDEAVRRVLEMQHKPLELPVDQEITPEDEEKIDRINRESTCARCDKGLLPAIDQEKLHYFVVLAENSLAIDSKGKIDVDTWDKGWYRPGEIVKRLGKLFPGSFVQVIHEFPTPSQIKRALEDSVSYDDVVFVTFINSQAYVGREALTARVVSLIQALQVSGRIAALVHYGNPFVLEELEHIPRVLMGGVSAENVLHTLDILAGKEEARGVPAYEIHLK